MLPCFGLPRKLMLASGWPWPLAAVQVVIMDYEISSLFFLVLSLFLGNAGLIPYKYFTKLNVSMFNNY